MSNKLNFLVILMILLFVMTTPAGAITYGTADDNEHPCVGLAVFDDADGNPLWRCSGTLLGPTLFLTAGHCTAPPAVRATIWFEEDVDAGIPDNGYPFGGPTSVDGTTYTHPQYDPNAFYLYDLGVVVLDEPVEISEYGVLPDLGLLDEIAGRRGLQDQSFTVVGYGLQRIIADVFLDADRVREKGTVMLIDVKGTAGLPAGTSAMFSNNPGKPHRGGTCFGDSGGPIFWDENTSVVTAVTSWGLNGNCAGTGAGYRIDTADDLDWLINEFGDLIGE